MDYEGLGETVNEDTGGILMLDATPPSPFYSADHEAFRQTVRRFVDREIVPHVDAWDEAEEFPRELY